MKKYYYPLIFLLFLSSVSFAQQLAPSIEWQKCLGGSGDDRAYAVLHTADNGLLVVGSSQSNDGDVTGHHGSTDSTDAWVVKLSAVGTLLWQKNLGGTGNDVFQRVIATSDGNYICMGSTTSINGDITGNHGGKDIWMVKLDRNGNIIWNKCFGGSQDETTGNIRQNQDGSLYFIGTTNSNNGDVSGNHPDNGINSLDIWVLKLENNGNIIRQACYGGSLDEKGGDIIETENGSFLMACTYNSSDGTFYVNHSNSPTAVIFKIAADNTVAWLSYVNPSATPLQLSRGPGKVFYINSQVPNECSRTAITPGIETENLQYDSSTTYFNNVGPGVNRTGSFQYCPPGAFVTGTFGYQSLGYPGFASVDGIGLTYALTSADSNNVSGYRGGATDGFIGEQIPGNAAHAWNKFIGGTGIDQFTSIAPLNETEFIVCGYTNSNNEDVSGNHGGYDFWVVKLGQTNKIAGSVFLDYNKNGIKDNNENYLSNIVVQSRKTSTIAASSSYNGLFSNSVDTGIYVTSIVTPVNYYAPVPVSKTSSFATYNTTDSLSFALQPVPGKRDYSINFYISFAVRPGFTFDGQIRYWNDGTDTLINKTVKLIKDSRLGFISSIPSQASISGDTITWVIDKLSPGESGAISVLVKAGTPPVLNINEAVAFTAIIDSTGDLTPLNNIFRFVQNTTGSYDPNDKKEAGNGSVTTREISDKKNLQYTIRFQNTGNDTAFTVIVKDTLDTKSDWSTIEMVDASHPYQLTIKNGSQLTWAFNNIKLVDSIHNEPLSHGYITYRIRPVSTLAVGDTIHNSASIYFDFNPPVKTNTQLTIVKSNPVPLPSIAGLQNTYCSILDVQKGKVTNLPAVSDSISVSVKLDGAVLPVATDSTFNINPSALAGGAHSIAVTFTNSGDAKTDSVHFTVTRAVTPNVNLSANITTAINLVDPIIITAANAAGGGALPRYTFAKDRTFTTILQAESSTSAVTIQSNTLIVGPNWIYAKMITSDTCYTVQTNTDSIDIERSAITGLTDVDFPNQVITIYPNPFSHVINISGLNAGKTYTVSISNTAGQKLYSLQVNNRQSVSIERTGLQSGSYWLGIYDYKKQTLIGTVPVIKE